MVSIGCGASIWQLGRADTKIALAANLQARQQMPILNANSVSWTLDEARERRMIVWGNL
ncbi:hypothetical protein [Polynucleobacter necessarius]|uniref:hypothetical protein n=1 Tax=Polynucleobacter necessarius TaxID=576610 RepID=UPI001E478D73|nr:hypothetical protein [Polynucleobacter necessarius]